MPRGGFERGIDPGLALEHGPVHGVEVRGIYPAVGQLAPSELGPGVVPEFTQGVSPLGLFFCVNNKHYTPASSTMAKPSAAAALTHRAPANFA